MFFTVSIKVCPYSQMLPSPSVQFVCSKCALIFSLFLRVSLANGLLRPGVPARTLDEAFLIIQCLVQFTRNCLDVSRDPALRLILYPIVRLQYGYFSETDSQSSSIFLTTCQLTPFYDRIHTL